jgi:aspartyl-tRNA(Asn)/glutamyl-tRNA(Gln) amidotransferase subunit C
MKIDRDLLSYLSKLARLRLDEQEAERLIEDLTRLLEYFESLREIVPVVTETPESTPTRDAAPLREDRVTPSLAQGEALSQAPEVLDGQFAVPKVLPGDPGSQTGKSE